MAASHFGLHQLTAVVDYNKMQSDANNDEIMRLEPLVDKWSAFGWHVLETDGHSVPAIARAFDAAHSMKDRPSVLIAHTVKGKGVSFMENVPSWHGSVRLTKEQVVAAWDELGVDCEFQDELLAGRIWSTP